MSEKEFDQGNEELFGVVNGHATPEATEQAEQIAQQVEETGKTTTQPTGEKQVYCIKADYIKAGRRPIVAQLKQVGFLILKVLACVLVAGLFLAALLLPAWVLVLCYAGLAVCLIVASVMTDRHFRR